jgi:hypothetical protein
MPITRINGLEPLAEVERALLVVEVLHAPHPELGGLLLGLGEHFCTQRESWSASGETDKTHAKSGDGSEEASHWTPESHRSSERPQTAPITRICPIKTKRQKDRNASIFCHRTTQPCQQALPVKRHLAQRLHQLAPNNPRTAACCVTNQAAIGR